MLIFLWGWQTRHHLYLNVCLDLTPVKDLTNAMFVETDLLPKEISRFISPDIPKVSLTFR